MLGDSSGKGFKLPYIFDINETAWKVLLSLLIQRVPMGPRDIARKMGMKSHTLAIYHLNKLIEYNLVEKTAHGDYQINHQADFDFFYDILFLKKRMIPYIQLTFGVFFITIFFIYYFVVGFDDSFQSGIIAVLCMLGAGLWFVEAYRNWFMSGFMGMNI